MEQTAKSKLGQIGEELTCRHLVKSGYEVIMRNYFSRFGEIDIIAQKQDLIIFVEVKTRQSNAMVKPIEAVTKKKQRKLIKTAVDYLIKHKTDKQPRFDIVSITISHCNGRNLYSAEHIENAFDTTGIYTPF